LQYFVHEPVTRQPPAASTLGSLTGIYVVYHLTRGYF
jgi:hypothetical protein